jgi:hypothetical protein
MPAASVLAAQPQPQRTKPEAQSRVTTGAQLFLDRIDGRSALARRYRDVLAQLVAALDGAPTDAQAMLCRRAATLSVWCEQAESDMAGGAALDISTYNTSSNTLRRTLAELGLVKPRTAPTPKPEPKTRNPRQNCVVNGGYQVGYLKET